MFCIPFKRMLTPLIVSGEINSIEEEMILHSSMGVALSSGIISRSLLKEK